MSTQDRLGTATAMQPQGLCGFMSSCIGLDALMCLVLVALSPLLVVVVVAIDDFNLARRSFPVCYLRFCMQISHLSYHMPVWAAA